MPFKLYVGSPVLPTPGSPSLTKSPNMQHNHREHSNMADTLTTEILTTPEEISAETLTDRYWIYKLTARPG